jgi:hypothetical protein
MAERYLTIVTVLRGGQHVVHQLTGALPGQLGVIVGSHIALRQRHYPGDVERFVVVDGSAVSEHMPLPENNR